MTARELNPDELIRLLTRQRDGYRRLCALAARQREMISRNDPEALLSILSERQRIVSALAAANVALAPYRGEWAARLSRLAGAARAQVEALLGEISAAAQSVMQSDREDAALLSARKQALGQAVSGLGGGATANAAYARGAGAGAGGRSTDLTG